jgi:hypothetical protein
MGWVLWLVSPVVATTLVALVTWWRNRPAAPLTSEQAVIAHRVFLDALADAPSRPAPGRR